MVPHRVPTPEALVSRRFLAPVALAGLVAAAVPAAGRDEPKFPAPKSLGPVETYGKNVRRAMHLMATSTPEKRNTVRVLFYGQSITAQAWTRAVAADLRARFPHADLVVENRAISGHAAQMLVKTAEADLYPFYPDLLIFHVYGSHPDYESIIRRTRERTTADVLHTTNHPRANEGPEEETDPAKLSPKQWEPWFNHAFLPSLQKKYGTELADVRGLWKRYLADHNLKPQDLLRDGVHLNAHGEYVMAQLVSAHLRYDPKAAAPADDRVKTLVVGKDVGWKDGKLTLPFEGNRVDLVCGPGKGGPVAVRVDGKKPSEFAGAYALTRTTAYPTSNYPTLLRVGSEKPRAAEEWTLTLTELNADFTAGKFAVTGSATGDDGAGEVGKRFVSTSGRVVIEADDWNLAYCLKVHGDHLKLPFAIRWKAVLTGADEFAPPGAKDGAAVETVVTVAQGLPNGKHTLELAGGPDVPVAAVRVYKPAPVPAK